MPLAIALEQMIRLRLDIRSELQPATDATDLPCNDIETPMLHCGNSF
jgi:hypothetical protein